MRFSSTALLIAPLAYASSHHNSYSHQADLHPGQIQVFLHPSPSSPHAASAVPTLTADQAKAVLAHHMGDALSDFDEIPANEGMWGHLMGLWEKEEREGRVVIVEGGVSPQLILPSTISDQPSFYMPADADADSVLTPYLEKAKTFLQAVGDKLPSYVKDFVDDFEIAGSKAAASLQQELSTLIAMSEKHLIPFLNNLKHSTWEAVRISGLADFAEDSNEYEQTTKTVQAGLESMSQPDSPPLLVIIRPKAQSHFSTPNKRDLPILKPTSMRKRATECYKSEDECKDGTSCSDHGACSMLGKKGDDECWGCKCADGYAGAECQKTDYSVPFMVIFFTSLFLILIVIGSIALLSSVGDTKLPSTLTLAVGGPAKRD